MIVDTIYTKRPLRIGQTSTYSMDRKWYSFPLQFITANCYLDIVLLPFSLLHTQKKTTNATQSVADFHLTR